MVVEGMRVDSKAGRWRCTNMIWLVIILQWMANAASVEGLPDLRYVTYYDKFGDVVSFAYYDGEVEVECRRTCDERDEFQLVHETGESAASAPCERDKATMRVPVRKLKFGAYHCAVGKSGNWTKSDNAMQFSYRGCNQAEGVRKCRENGTFCIVQQSNVQCEKSFERSPCNNHDDQKDRRRVCPANERSLCDTIVRRKYEGAQTEQKDSDCEDGLPSIWYDSGRKLGESVELKSENQVTVSCLGVANNADVICQFKRPNGTTAGEHSKLKCDDVIKVNLTSEFFTGWGVNKVQCHLNKAGKDFRVYVYFVSMFGNVTIETILDADNDIYTDLVKCVMVPALPQGFDHKCELKVNGTKTRDINYDGVQIGEQDSGTYQCECNIHYRTYTPFTPFAKRVRSEQKRVFGKPGRVITTGGGTGIVTYSVIDTRTDLSNVSTVATPPGFLTKYYWALIVGSVVAVVVVIVVVVVLTIRCAKDTVERVLRDADAQHGKREATTKSAVKKGEQQAPSLPEKTKKVIAEMDRMTVFAQSMHEKMNLNFKAAEDFWITTYKGIVQHPAGKCCHMMEVLRWVRGSGTDARFKFRDPRVKNPRCLDMFEIPVMDNDRILLGLDANYDDNPTKACFHLLLAYYETKTGLVVQFGGVTNALRLSLDFRWPGRLFAFWPLQKGRQETWPDPDDGKRMFTVNTTTKILGDWFDWYVMQVEFSDQSGKKPSRELRIMHMNGWDTHFAPTTYAKDKTVVKTMRFMMDRWREQANKGLRTIAFHGPRAYLCPANCAILYLHIRLWDKHRATNLHGLMRWVARRGVDPWNMIGPDKKPWSECAGQYALNAYGFVWRCARLMIELPERVGEDEKKNAIFLEKSVEVPPPPADAMAPLSFRKQHPSSIVKKAVSQTKSYFEKPTAGDQQQCSVKRVDSSKGKSVKLPEGSKRKP